MAMLTEPRQHVTDCTSCRGMGGFARGATAFDACDRCGGSGQRYRYECTAQRLDGECGERVVVVVTRHDVPGAIYGCIDGHRWDVQVRAGAVTWTRLEDRVASVVEVAS